MGFFGSTNTVAKVAKAIQNEDNAQFGSYQPHVSTADEDAGIDVHELPAWLLGVEGDTGCHGSHGPHG